MTSFHEFNRYDQGEELVGKLEEGLDIALITDAGTPGISDPGEEIVKCAIENNIEIVPIPGACALINALIASGFPTKEFCFIGFLSTIKKEKREKLTELKNETKTIILYEAPHRLSDTLKDILEELGDRNIVIARELTKIHEEFIRGTISQVLEKGINNKGEFVILIEGSNVSKKELEILNLNEKTLEEHYKFYEEKGLDKKEIIKQIAKDRKVSKNEIYQYFLN